MPLRCLFVDFNSYFASVEQELRPELRGRPVGVVPSLVETTCCIAASYEAKRHGVKTGTLVAEARRLCPGIELVEARPSEYVAMHHRAIAAVESCVHVDHVHSIDEMSCALTGCWQERARAEELAVRIKEAVARECGEWIRCSIGIAPNTFLAKTATDMQKPDGLVVLEEAELPRTLFRLELADFCGIGPAMEARVRAGGVTTVEELCGADRGWFRRVWGGVEGERFYERLHGRVLPDEEPAQRTLGHSHVLPPRERNETDARAVLDRLLQKAAMRLRGEQCVAGALSLSLKYTDRKSWGAERRFFETSDTGELLRHLEALWRDRPRHPQPVQAVGVVLGRLQPLRNHTPSLFAARERTPEREALHRALDELNLRYGRNTVVYGGALAALDAAPMRIAFTRVPQPATEADGEERAARREKILERRKAAARRRGEVHRKAHEGREGGEEGRGKGE